MRVSELMSRDLVTIDESESCHDAVTRMSRILTETDILRLIVRADTCCSPEVEEIVVSFP